METIGPSFEADRKFGSMDEAAKYLKDEYLLELPNRSWLEQSSGVLVPHWTPRYLFRGECGDFQTRVAGSYRPNAYCLKDDGRRLGAADLAVLGCLLPSLAQRFKEGYSLDEPSALGLLQHYGLPTWLIDFTCHLGHAITFAGSGDGVMGRICVFPTAWKPDWVTVVNLMNHEWCERPRRQCAFRVTVPPGRRDLNLKSTEVRRALRLRWYQFPISDEDREYPRSERAGLARLDDDPSAGFIRRHITEYVEANGKLSPPVTDWLLERVPIMPQCAEIKSSDGTGVVVQHRPASVLSEVDCALETDWSRRYWSTAFPDSSWDRMKDWTWPPVGVIYADPRTFHGAINRTLA